MNIKQFSCPNCDSRLNPNMIEDNTSIYCPYCGYYFTIENGNQNQTINHNINKTININKNIHNRYTNDAEVIRAKTEEKQHHSSNAWGIFWVIVVISLIVVAVIAIKKDEDQRADQINSEVQAGKIRVKYSSESFKDENYKTVKAKLEDAGFTNIEVVDLDDSGIAFWDFGKVEFVSINGNNYFTESSYYMPDDKIIIYHH